MLSILKAVNSINDKAGKVYLLSVYGNYVENFKPQIKITKCNWQCQIEILDSEKTTRLMPFKIMVNSYLHLINRWLAINRAELITNLNVINHNFQVSNYIHLKKRG